MTDTGKGKIFLAAERGHTETNWLRSYNTFHFGPYRREHKTPFGPLYILNDDTVAGGKSFSSDIERDSLVILLPVVGAVTYKDSAGNNLLVSAGECLFTVLKKGQTITLENPHENELINFLQCWIQVSGAVSTLPAITSFDLSKKNNLLPLYPSANSISDSSLQPPVRCFIGKFDGRAKGRLPSETNKGLFAFVIEGALEVNDRLVESRDGLALWDVEEIGFEALSNEAIIFMLGLPFENEKSTNKS